MARGVDQLSGATGAIPDGPRGLRALPGDSGLCQGPAVSNCSPGHLTLASEGPRGRPAGPDDSGSCPRAREVDLRFWVTRVRALWPAGSTSCAGPLGPGSEWPTGSTRFPGRLGPGSEVLGFHQFTRASGARVRRPSGSTSCLGGLVLESVGPRGRPALPGDLRLCPRARGVDEHSRATRARVRGPVCANSSPG